MSDAATPTSVSANTKKAIGVVIALALLTSVVLIAKPRGGSSAVAVEVPSGTTFVANLQTRLTTEGGETGTPVRLETSADVSVGDGLVVPAGSIIRGEVTHTKGGGRIEGAPEITIRFREIEVDGKGYDIESEPFRLKGKDDAKESVAEIGGGAVAGAVIGAIAGGGGGAVKGAAVGAVLGTGVAVVTKGDQIELNPGTKFRIRLSAPVTMTLQPAAAP